MKREKIHLPRGFKVAIAETREAYESGTLTDKHKRSFIGRAPDMSLHELLAGEDKTRRYSEVMAAAAGWCQGCQPPHYVGTQLEWDHIQGGLSGRCDCIYNSRGVCRSFHLSRHYQVGRSTLKEPKSKCPGIGEKHDENQV